MFRERYMLLAELILMMHTGTEWELEALYTVRVLDPEEGGELLQSRKADMDRKGVLRNHLVEMENGERESQLLSALGWGKEYRKMTGIEGRKMGNQGRRKNTEH